MHRIVSCSVRCTSSKSRAGQDCSKCNNPVLETVATACADHGTRLLGEARTGAGICRCHQTGDKQMTSFRQRAGRPAAIRRSPWQMAAWALLGAIACGSASAQTVYVSSEKDHKVNVFDAGGKRSPR